MDFLPNSALKISALTLAIAATASCTAMTPAAEYQSNNTNATSNGITALALGNTAMA